MVESLYTIDLPTTDVASFVFSSGTPASRQKQQYFDADSPSKCFSLAQAEGYVKQLARGLQKLGLKDDDKILLFSQNQLFFPVVLWGTLAAGCVFTACNPSASASELKYQLADSDAKILLTHPETAHIALDAAAEAGMPRESVYLFTEPGVNLSKYSKHGLRAWTDIWCSPEEVKSWTWRKVTRLEEAMSKTAVLNYSSGTTGLPKGVELSHYNVISNSMQLVHKRSIISDTLQGKARKARIDLSGERWLAPLPMYHAYGQTYYCMNAARIGAKVYIMPKFNINKLLLYSDIYRITFMTAVPVVLTMLSKQSNPGRFNLNSIEAVVTGSAPLSPEIAGTVEEMYLRPDVKVKQGLGMTEITCSIFGFAPDEEDDGRSVGRLYANCRAKLMPVEGRDFSASTPPGTNAGEIWVSGPNIMKGYYKRPKETAETIVYEDGSRWLRTGDVGYFDASGKLYLIDRLKELIKVKGLQVSPAELELALLEHPDVNDAAVVGAKINGGEYPRAFVTRKNGVVTETKLKELIQKKFAPHKWLTGGVYFIDAIPRTGSGKVVRRALPTVVPVQTIVSKL